jgi:crotonobetainyl-CoA:carnitine CoA-transferase CaiB-like acyl-CoA transferase
MRKQRVRGEAEWITPGVPVGPANTIGEALSHPRTPTRGMVVELEHPRAGPTKALGRPLHLSANIRANC